MSGPEASSTCVQVWPPSVVCATTPVLEIARPVVGELKAIPVAVPPPSGGDATGASVVPSVVASSVPSSSSTNPCWASGNASPTMRCEHVGGAREGQRREVSAGVGGPQHRAALAGGDHGVRVRRLDVEEVEEGGDGQSGPGRTRVGGAQDRAQHAGRVAVSAVERCGREADALWFRARPVPARARTQNRVGRGRGGGVHRPGQRHGREQGYPGTDRHDGGPQGVSPPRARTHEAKPTDGVKHWRSADRSSTMPPRLTGPLHFFWGASTWFESRVSSV